MIRKVYKILNYLETKLSLIFFSQRIPLKYILFNFIYKKLILDISSSDEEILKFHKSGFVKLKVNLQTEIKQFKDKLTLNKNELEAGKKRVNFELPEKDKLEFIKAIKYKLNPTIKKLESYFKCNVFISDALPFRIYNLKNSNSTNEVYSNFYHQDGYIKIYNKIHVNLMDVGPEDGPLQIVPIENRSKFIKSFKYKDRNNYNSTGDENLIYKNIGKIGDCCLFSSSEVMHKAGVPMQYRDMLQLILITYPKNDYEKLFYNNEKKIFYPHNHINIQKVSKPTNLIKIFKTLIVLFKNKLLFSIE